MQVPLGMGVKERPVSMQEAQVESPVEVVTKALATQDNRLGLVGGEGLGVGGFGG